MECSAFHKVHGICNADAQTYLLTGARINLTLLHLCPVFSEYPLRKKSGSLGPETVAGFLYF